MAILLDTHAAIWYALGSAQLSAAAREAIEQETQGRHISPASYWEIAIKVCRGNYTLSVPLHEFWTSAIGRCGYSILAIDLRHADFVSRMPLHHRDPFDRMLVAQAACEGFSLVSSDPQLDRYGINRIW